MAKRKPKCEACGDEVEMTMQLSTGKYKSKKICDRCVKAGIRGVMKKGGAVKKSKTPVMPPESTLIDDEISEPIPAPSDIVELADAIRAESHENRLKGARIRYVLTPGPKPVPGKRVDLGKPRRVSKVMKTVAKADFVISINWAAWQLLTETQRAALIDHELTHCEPKQDKDGLLIGWQIRKHDVEDFVEIVERRGLWQEDLQRLCRVVQAHQGELFENVESAAR